MIQSNSSYFHLLPNYTFLINPKKRTVGNRGRSDVVSLRSFHFLPEHNFGPDRDASMSTELQQTDVMDADIVSAEMIEDAVANCFVTIEDAPERALELVTPEEIAAIEEADDDLDGEAA